MVKDKMTEYGDIWLDNRFTNNCLMKKLIYQYFWEIYVFCKHNCDLVFVTIIMICQYVANFCNTHCIPNIAVKKYMW